MLSLMMKYWCSCWLNINSILDNFCEMCKKTRCCTLIHWNGSFEYAYHWYRCTGSPLSYVPQRSIIASLWLSLSMWQCPMQTTVECSASQWVLQPNNSLSIDMDIIPSTNQSIAGAAGVQITTTQCSPLPVPFCVADHCSQQTDCDWVWIGLTVRTAGG